MAHTDKAFAALTAADFGILAATLDDCRGSGDDDTVDALADAITFEEIAPLRLADALAYHIVHDLKRRLVDATGTLHATAINASGRRVAICIPGRDA